MSQLIIPEMGSGSEAEVIEILIAEGDSLELEQSTLVLESEKATIEVPADKAGTVTKLLVKVGDKFTGGEAYADIDELASAAVSTPEPAVEVEQPKLEEAAKNEPVSEPQPIAPVTEKPIAAASALVNDSDEVYAGPAVRRLARELGVDLTQVTGTGLKQRIQKEDVQNYVKQRLQSGVSGAGIPAVADIDFSQFGEVTEQPLNNIKRATAKAMTIANLNVPQVTQFDEADITELEAFRVQQNELYSREGIRFSIVPFVVKALARCLHDYPNFNSSLNSQGTGLVVKKYVHIGVAVDTPKGLLVPVLQNVDQKSVTQIRQELQEKAELARAGKLSLADMQGACMSVSSLGGIGGTSFTPIVNPPEVAILGLSKASMQPLWKNEQFIPRLILPLSLSYDHRVIDGAEAARFSQALVGYLQDLRRLIM